MSNLSEMSRLEWYAGLAMQGLLSRPGEFSHAEIVEKSFNIAEQMVAAHAGLRDPNRSPIKG